MGLTKKKITKPKCLLLDANIVIEAYKLGIWDQLIERFSIAVPSIVVKNEALFYSKKDRGIPEPINLPDLIIQGKIVEIGADSNDLLTLDQNFDLAFKEGLDPGEREALAIIMCGKAAEYFLCTGDANAIQALALLGLSELGISLEKVLLSVGLERKLSFWFRDDFFIRNIRIGQKKKIQGEGIRSEKIK